MKKILLLCILIVSANAMAQQHDDALLIGAWRTENVTKKPSNPHYRDLIDSFKGATFRLFPDHTVEINTDDNSQDFATIRKITKGKSWKFDAITNTIKIGDATDNFSTMKIKVRQADGKIFFAMAETYQNIEVEVTKHELPQKKL